MGRWSTMCIVVLVTGSATACNPAQRAEQAKQVVDSGNSAACVQEKSSLEKAVATFTMLNPDTPVTEAALVAGGILHEQSKLMDLAGATVVPAPGTVCT
jgi:hypothetical protein